MSKYEVSVKQIDAYSRMRKDKKMLLIRTKGKRSRKNSM